MSAYVGGTMAASRCAPGLRRVSTTGSSLGRRGTLHIVEARQVDPRNLPAREKQGVQSRVPGGSGHLALHDLVRQEDAQGVLTAGSGAGRTAGFCTRTAAGLNPSPVAVSVSVPGSFVDCTMTCARPLKTLRIQGDGGITGALVRSRLTAVLKSPFGDSFDTKTTMTLSPSCKDLCISNGGCGIHSCVSAMRWPLT